MGVKGDFSHPLCPKVVVYVLFAGLKSEMKLQRVRTSHIIVFLGLQDLSSPTAKQEFASSLCNIVAVVQVVVVVLVLKLL